MLTLPPSVRILVCLSPADNVMKPYYERECRAMRAAQNMGELFELLRSGEEGINREWLLRQAARRGATDAQMREAVVSYLRIPAEVTARQSKSELVSTGRKLGIFSPADYEEFDVISRQQGLRWTAETARLPWATLPDTRMRECYGYGGG